jgi:hypothetical protein
MRADEARLREDLDTSRKRYQAALRLANEANSIYRSVGHGHPDGMQALRNANHELHLATEQYHRALKQFSEAVLRITDGDLGLRPPREDGQEAADDACSGQG